MRTTKRDDAEPVGCGAARNANDEPGRGRGMRQRQEANPRTPGEHSPNSFAHVAQAETNLKGMKNE